MADEQPAAPDSTPEQRMAAFFAADAGAPEQPAEGQAQEASASDEHPPADEPQAEEQPQDDSAGYEEIDLDGEKYRVPPKLKDAVLRQADYTRKTQEVAEARRQVESQMHMLQLNQQFQQSAAQDYAQITAVESQIAQFKGVDWTQLDTQTYLQAKHKLDELKEQAANLKQGLAGKAQQFMRQQEQIQQQRLASGLEYLRKTLPKFDADTVASIRQAAEGEGFSRAEIDSMADPRVVRLLWKAQQYDAIQSGKTAAVQAVKKAPPVIKPGASQGQGQVAANRYKDARQQLKKSGDLKDAARLFALRMK